MKKTDMETYGAEVRRLVALKHTRKAMAETLDISLTRLNEIIAKIRVEELHAQYLAARDALYQGGGHRILWNEPPIPFASSVTLTLSERTKALYAAIKREPHRYYGLYIGEMNFDVRLDNILKNGGITWLGSLISHPDLETLPGMGRKTLDELDAVLATCGLKMKSLEEDWHQTQRCLIYGHEADILKKPPILMPFDEITDEDILEALLPNDEHRKVSAERFQSGDPDAIKAMEGLRRVVQFARRPSLKSDLMGWT